MHTIFAASSFRHYDMVLQSSYAILPRFATQFKVFNCQELVSTTLPFTVNNKAFAGNIFAKFASARCNRVP